MQYLQQQIARFNVPHATVETILARNPAAIYGFDLEQLQQVAERIGPVFEATEQAA